ncbi:MAG: 5-carboxymethyl-2-hydroxymuconate Delta-isomerase [Rhodoferax sp.]|nr:5-carboxymethyl-2-hydroxymuconate Delta-isomerase [Rhodoferax sp.]MBP9931884.1 5-carboxymethyl-2-hydroxymuconate Delta-isomerase [Rhodoferax sp.]HQX57572.1 5-carboxymethyl-2-hydroxymuconate Delta-isomerase [Burkholderiaceae bacterium]HQZ04765.1 5-carboxymethyl-2-hydroxymuconate Delta-isomerase [Burkholderiaceae bacterium]HRA61524.1 5-carboxymethyl-2-hydroxymuconate Delta-isomerase [Burkholderiaceae bacterium]
MPHLVVLYTPNLDRETDMTALCRALADTMLQTHDDDGKQVFPTGGTRVLAYPAAHYAVADGKADYAFVYLNMRMASGRSAATHKRAGDALLMCAKAHFQPVFKERHIGITLQIDEGHEVFDAKHSNLHPLFQTPVNAPT